MAAMIAEEDIPKAKETEEDPMFEDDDDDETKAVVLLGVEGGRDGGTKGTGGTGGGRSAADKFAPAIADDEDDAGNDGAEACAAADGEA